MNTGNNLLFLMVAGMLAFMSVTGIIGMANLKGLKVSLTPPDDVHAGRPAVFSLHLASTGKLLPSFLLELSCGTAAVRCTFLPRSSAVDLPLTLQFDQRGAATIRHLKVSSPFPVNFFVRSWGLPLSCDLLVFPRQTPCGAGAAGGDGRRHVRGGRLHRGVTGEMELIRDYTGREPLKAIHWKLSAREEKVKVREYGEASLEPLLIDPATLPGDMEERVAAAAWLAAQWGERRPVGLVLDGEVLPPQQGKRQVRGILARLALYGIEGRASANAVQAL